MARVKPRMRISGRARLAGAKLPQEGTFTATETGAREAAQIRHMAQTYRDLVNSMASMEGTEKFIRTGRGPRKKGK